MNLIVSKFGLTQQAIVVDPDPFGLRTELQIVSIASTLPVVVVFVQLVVFVQVVVFAAVFVKLAVFAAVFVLMKELAAPVELLDDTVVPVHLVVAVEQICCQVKVCRQLR